MVRFHKTSGLCHPARNLVQRRRPRFRDRALRRLDIPVDRASSVELLAGSTVVATAPLATDPGSGNWATLTATYTSATNDPLAEQALTILLDGDAALINNYDNVRLRRDCRRGAPEPSTWALFSLGAAAFVAKRRRRRKT